MLLDRIRGNAVLRAVAVSVLMFAGGVAGVRVGSPARVTVAWETASETDTVAFHVYRSRSPSGPFSVMTETPVPAVGDPLLGASYKYADEDVHWGGRYFYQLEEVERDGTRSRYPTVVEGRAGVGWGWAISAGTALAALGALGAKMSAGTAQSPRDMAGAAPEHPPGAGGAG